MSIKKRLLAGVIAAAMAATMLPSALTASAATPDVLDGLIARYQFDEKSGTTFGNSIYGGASDASFAIEDTAGYWGAAGLVDSPNGKALHTNNHKTLIPASALAGVSDVTIQMYVKVNYATNWSRMWSICASNAQNDGYSQNRSLSVTARDISGRKLGFNYQLVDKGDIAMYASTNNFDTEVKGAYHLISFVQSGNNGKLYVDGNVVAEGDVKGDKTVGNIVAACDDSHPAIIALGWAPEWNDTGMNMEIDDFRIYGKALSAENIAAQVTKYGEGKAHELSTDDLIYNIDFNSAEADNRTIKNNVAGNPDCIVYPDDIGRTAGTLGDGAISFANRDSQTHSHIYATANQMKSVNSQTFSMWVKPKRTDRQFLFTSGPLDNVKSPGDNGNNRGNYALALIIDDRLKWEVKVDGTTKALETGRGLFSDPNKWYHFSFVKDGNIGRIYMNGIVVAETTDFTVDMSKLVYDKYGSSVDYKIDIGGNSIWGDARVVEEGLQGEMDEFRVYNRALSTQENQRLYKYWAGIAGEKISFGPAGDVDANLGEDVIHSFFTATDFNGFKDNYASSKGNNQWRGKALPDGSVLATRYGGSDHFLWGPRIPESKRANIESGKTYYIKALVRVTNKDRALDRNNTQNVFTFDTVDGEKYATFDKATFDANPGLYGGQLLKEGEWVSLVWPFEATDSTNRGAEFRVISNWGVNDHQSMDYFLQFGNRIVISSNNTPLAVPTQETASPYFAASLEDVAYSGQWDQGKDVYHAWDLPFVGGQDRRIRVPDGSSIALESNHIYYGMSLPEAKRNVPEGTDFYFKLLLKVEGLENFDMNHWLLEWDWDDRPIAGQTMPSVFQGKEGEWVSLVYKLSDPTKLNSDHEGRFRLHGSRLYKIYTGRYLVMSTDPTPLGIPNDKEAAVTVDKQIEAINTKTLKIEFEDLDEIQNDELKIETNDDGTVVANTDIDGTIYKYNSIDFGNAQRDTISVRYSAKQMDGSAGTYIEFRVDDPTNGTVIGTVSTPDTGSWSNFVTATGKITNNVTGVHDVYVILHKPGVDGKVPQYVGNLNWFSFSDSTEKPVTVSDVRAARLAYRGLTDAQKALVTKLDVLTAVEAKFNLTGEVADQNAADAVMALIAELPAVEDITVYDEPEIEAARAAYEALTATQKALVTNLDVLEAAEAALEAIGDEENQAVADGVIALIADLPQTITVNDKNAVETARAAYEALTNSQKALVTNLDVLEAAEAALAVAEANKAAADAVIDQIAALPSATNLALTDKAAVEAARAAYNALTDAQKAFVTNLNALVAAETIIDLLTPKTVAVTGVTISGVPSYVAVGKTATLTAKITPDNATDKTVVWLSSNTSVATVNAKGVVKAVAPGKATITVIASGGKTATCNIIVKGHVTKVTVKKAVTSLKVNKTLSLSSVIKSTDPAKAYRLTPKYTLSVANKNKKYVSIKGTKVKALKKGVGKTVTVTIKNNGKKVGTFKVKITKK